MNNARTKKPSGTTKGGSKSSAQTGQKGASSSSKNSKESFQKKLLICQRVYDYYDESKDVKGKTERLNAINEI
mgnify:CR=1 FL=1|jgi:hypothetical protein